MHELAGKPAPREILINVPRLVAAYYSTRPDPQDPAQQISFGTSGHRGSSLDASFNQDHILAVTQAICDHRAGAGIKGPLFMGMDTHALSEPALMTALEVLAANQVQTVIQAGRGYTPTPVISHAILTHNRGGGKGVADGIVITPSHNPPRDGGFKYNPPEGGPAGADITASVQDRANEILAAGLDGVQRIPFARALAADTTEERDFVMPYVRDLKYVVDLDAVRSSRLSIGADPMGGSGVAFWEPIAQEYGLDITVTNPEVDPTFSFMTVDKDGKIRMDCSSPQAMASLIAHRDRFDVAFGNDPDFDRHGIVTKAGLMNPNHYLSVAVEYLFQNRPDWPEKAAVGKTLVSSSMIDRVAESLGRDLCEVPVGFKWFVDGLLEGSMGFGGEESAGASFLRKDAAVWTTDKDGIIMDLLACEITAKTGRTPSELWRGLTERFGEPVYKRMDSPASPEQKKALKGLSPDMVESTELAGEKIRAVLTRAPGNDAPIGGLKVAAESGWFAARPSGTEDIYKVYAESFQGEDHLARIQEEALDMVGKAFKAAGV